MNDIMIKGIMKISDREFQLISGLVYEQLGIRLTEQKKTLVEGRLNKIIHQLELKNFKEFYDFVQNDRSGAALTLLIDKITTNHTYFFREKDHFDFLRDKILPELTRLKLEKKQNSIKIWCAGCASGEESYTLAMVLLEYFGPDIKNWDIGILASDISLSVLKQASCGIYIPDKVKDMPPGYLHKYFHKLPDGNVEVNPVLKPYILFKRFNLMQNDYPFRNKFDIIFCRNVMIYFDSVTRKTLVEKYAKYLETSGYLFIGHSETLGRDTPDFNYIKPAVYRRK